MEKEKAEKESFTDKVEIPEWAPKMILGVSSAVIGALVLAILWLAAFAMRGLHESFVPWWGIMFVYLFVGGMAFRASRQFKAWKSGMENTWGSYSRWVNRLAK